MKTKKICILAAVFLMLLVCASGTFAYFTYWKQMKNSFTIGENVIEIVENYKPPKEMQAGDNLYKKNIKVKNSGTVPCYIRLFVDFSDSEIRDCSLFSSDGTNYYPVTDYPAHLPATWTYEPSSESLIGGYYYYTEQLQPGQTTIPLIEAVNTKFESAEKVKNYEIIVYAESVQVLDKNGSQFEGSTPYLDAWTEFLKRR